MFLNSRASLTIYFLIVFSATVYADTANSKATQNERRSILTFLQGQLEAKLADYASYLTKWLESFNDKHLGASELGRLMHYEEIKPKLEVESARSRRKMSMAMMPLIFHVGATSTWMVLTSIMAAKSVAIGLALLIFKIAVSSAKLASFFTSLKSKQDHHHGWYDHGHERSFSNIVEYIPDHHTEHHVDHHSSYHPHESYHKPEWSPSVQQYHTIPSSYKHAEHELEPYKDFHFTEKTAEKKFT